MTKKLILAAVLAFAFVASSLMAQTTDLLSLAPAETDLVLQINLQKVFSNPDVIKNINQNLAKNPSEKAKLDEIINKTGFNPLKDLNRICVFASGKADKTGAMQSAGMVLDGNFNVAKILEAITKDEKASKEVSVSKISGFNAIVPKDSQEGYGVFLDSRTVVVGTKTGVDAVLDTKAGKNKGVASNKSLYAVVVKADKTAFLSGAGLFPAELKEKIKTNPQAAALANLDYFFFNFDIGDMIKFAFNGQVDKKENVEAVMTTLNGVVALLKMISAQAPEFAEVLNLIKLEAKNLTVELSLELPKAKLQEIKNKLEERMKKMQAEQEGGIDAPRE